MDTAHIRIPKGFDTVVVDENNKVVTFRTYPNGKAPRPDIDPATVYVVPPKHKIADAVNYARDYDDFKALESTHDETSEKAGRPEISQSTASDGIWD